MQLARSVRWKELFVLMAAGMICIALAGPSVNRAAADPPSGYHLSYGEEFNGTSLAGTKFNYTWTDGVGTTTDAVSVGGGNLTLTSYSTGSGATLQNCGGCVSTTGIYAYTYGYTEARIKFNNSQGNVMAYWLDSDAMFENNGSNSPARGNETDIIEQRATDGNNNNVQDMDHVNLWAGGYGSGSHNHDPNTPPTVSGLGDGSWHTIGLLWTSTGYTFSVDGVTTWSYYPSALDNLLYGKVVSNGPEYLIFDSAPSGGWAGTTLPAGYGSLATSTTTMTVDYVRTYQLRPMAWNLGAGGSGTWNAANTNWSFTDGTAGTTFSNGDNLFFRGTGGTVTIASGFTPTVGSLQFESDNYTVAGGSLTLADNIVSVAGSMTATVSSSIGGSYGINMTGYGRLVLAGNNTYSGLTTVRGGSVLNIQHANALGSTSSGTSVESYAALEIQGGITTAAEPLTLNGPGVNWSGALRNISGNNNYTGPITLGSDTRICVDSGTLTLSGGVTSGGSALEVVPVVNTAMVINSPMSLGAGGLAMDGSGTLTLTASNSYTGATTVNAGVLNIQNSNAFGASSATVAGGAALQVQGGVTVPNALTLNGMGVANDGALRNVSGNNTYAGAIALGSAARINSDSGTLTLSGAVNPAGGLTIGGSGNTTITGTSSGESMTKDGSGTLAFTNALVVGNSSSGTFTLSAGAVTAPAETMSNGFTGAVTQSGGLNSISGNLNVGMSGTGSYTQNGGTNNVAGAEIIGSSPGSSYYTLTGGSNSVGALTFGSGNASSGGTYNLNGGTLTVGSGGITKGAGTGVNAAFNLAGGTLQAGAGFSSAVGLAASGASTVDTQGNSVTLSGPISGSGSLSKIGSGTLTMTAANSYGGVTTISQGTLQLGDGSTNNGSVSGNIADNATLVFANPNAQTYSGVISGNGAVTKSGAGTLTLSGASSYGATTVGAGQLTIGNNLTNSGALVVNSGTISQSGYVVSTAGQVIGNGGNGFYLQSGGTNTVSGAESICTGTTNGVTGTYTLSGGLNAAGSLVYGSNNPYETGTGIYNLNGGTLAVGSIVANNASEESQPSWKLNLGGGTLQATGNLTINSSTFFTMALTANGSTIDTHGNTVTISTPISGAYSLTKAGSGTLTLAVANTYSGGTTVSAGQLNINNNSALGAGPFSPGSGTTIDNTSGAAVTLSVPIGGALSASGGSLTFGGTSNDLTLSNLSMGSGASPTINVAGTSGRLILGPIPNSGGQSLTKQGPGTLVMAGDSAWTNAVTISINGGTLQLGNGGASGTFGSNAAVVDNAALTFNRASATIGNLISGTGAVAQNGSGSTITLTGANSYKGATTVNCGVLNIQNATALGTTAAGTTVAGGAALQIQGGITTPAEALTLNGTGIANDGALRNISGNNTFAGAITLGSATRINSDAGTLTVSPIITANNALTIGGSGNTTISSSFGSDLKTFTKDGSGALTVNGSFWVGYVSGASATLSNGTLNVSNEMVGYLQSGSITQAAGTTQSVSGSLYLGTIGISGATGDYWQNGGQNTVGTLYFGGSGVAPGGTYHLAGGTLTAGAISQGASGAAAVALSGGTLQAGAGFSSSVPVALTSTSTIDTQSYSPTFSGALSGSGSFNKIGSGTLILTGGNNYSGLTTVSAGVLELGTSAQSPVLTGGGADIRAGKIVFDYAGSDPAATIQGLLAASYDGGLWNTGQFRSSTASASCGLGCTDDTLNGKVTVGYALYGDANLDGTVNGADLNIALSNYNQTGAGWGMGDFNYDGAVNGADLNIVLSNYNQHVGVSSTGAVVPEPSTFVLLGSGALSLLGYAWRRRRALSDGYDLMGWMVDRDEP